MQEKTLSWKKCDLMLVEKNALPTMQFLMVYNTISWSVLQRVLTKSLEKSLVSFLSVKNIKLHLCLYIWSIEMQQKIFFGCMAVVRHLIRPTTPHLSDTSPCHKSDILLVRRSMSPTLCLYNNRRSHFICPMVRISVSFVRQFSITIHIPDEVSNKWTVQQCVWNLWHV